MFRSRGCTAALYFGIHVVGPRSVVSFFVAAGVRGMPAGSSSVDHGCALAAMLSGWHGMWWWLVLLMLVLMLV